MAERYELAKAMKAVATNPGDFITHVNGPQDIYDGLIGPLTPYRHGNEVDLHSLINGKLVKINAHTPMLPNFCRRMKSFDMPADNPGQWMYHCYVADHITAGMTSLYQGA
jgi:hypothetical protein